MDVLAVVTVSTVLYVAFLIVSVVCGAIETVSSKSLLAAAVTFLSAAFLVKAF